MMLAKLSNEEKTLMDQFRGFVAIKGQMLPVEDFNQSSTLVRVNLRLHKQNNYHSQESAGVWKDQ